LFPEISRLSFSFAKDSYPAQYNEFITEKMEEFFYLEFSEELSSRENTLFRIDNL